MKKRLFYAAICGLALGFVLGACSQADGPEGNQEVTENRPIDLTESQKALLGRVNEIGLDFIQSALNNPSPEFKEKNILVAPLNATENLVLNSFISRSQLEPIVKDVFGVENLNVLGEFFRQLNYALPYRDVLNVKYNKANSCWFEDDWITSGEQKSMTDYFGCDFANMDIHTSQAIDMINSWASENTDGMIPHVIDEILPDTRCISASAELFMGAWRSKFDPANTHPATFHGVDGDTEVQMMSQTCRYPHLKTPNEEVFIFLFGDGYYHLRIVLPCGDRTVYDLSKDGSLLQAFSFGGLDFVTCRGLVEFPKMELSSPKNGYELNKVFATMESFKNWQDNQVLTDLDNSQHTRAIFNEEGAKVAAVTVNIGETDNSTPHDFICDRPFVFAIFESESMIPVFAGRVVNL